jgi:hypothetical protein
MLLFEQINARLGKAGSLFRADYGLYPLYLQATAGIGVMQLSHFTETFTA